VSDYETLDQKLNAEILENKRLREALKQIFGTGMARYCASCGESQRIAKQALKGGAECPIHGEPVEGNGNGCSICDNLHKTIDNIADNRQEG